MNVLVTGSDGFVGQHLVAELKNEKHKVIEFDINKGQNISNKEQLKQALRGVGVVIHLAGIIENSNPNLWKVNVEGTKNIVNEAVKAKVKKFVFLSTTGVYGFPKEMVDEKSEVQPENNYEKSKVEGEKIVLERQEEIDVSVVRSAMILGPNKYWAKMFKMLQKGIPLPCNGKNLFQIIYVTELARILILVMKKGPSGEIYLAAGKEKYSLKSFCEEVKGVLGKKKKVLAIPTLWSLLLGKLFRVKILNKENIRHITKQRKYNTVKLEKLGWKQKYTLKEAIIKTIEDIKQMDL